MNLSEIRLKLDRRQISVKELIEDCIKKAKNDNCNCFITLCEDEALKSAEFAQRLIDNDCSSALTGIPVAVKDNICTAGVRTTCASRMLENFVPSYDSSVVEKLKAEGAVIFGKTNMDEFAMGSSSSSSYFGSVKNPLFPLFTSGGSSSGSAASVASGICSFALGSDTGGSVCQPAGFCGVVGLKPTYGRVSRYGLIAFASSLDQIGILTGNVSDAATVLETISGKDGRDMTCSNCFELEKIQVEGLKIGICDDFFEFCDAEVVKMVTDAMEEFKSYGLKFVKCSMPSLKDATKAYYTISSAEAFSNLGRYDGTHYGYSISKCDSFEKISDMVRLEGFGEEVCKRIAFGREVLYDGRYAEALNVRNGIINEYNKAYSKCDLIITPTSPVKPWNISNIPEKLYKFDICTAPVNLAGLPCVSIPCGKSSDGLPIGMNIVSNRFDESVIISVAQAFERRGCHEF